MTVSYTHLDVYKRQCQGNMGILAAALSAGGLTQKDLMELHRLLEEGEL